MRPSHTRATTTTMSRRRSPARARSTMSSCLLEVFHTLGLSRLTEPCRFRFGKHTSHLQKKSDNKNVNRRSDAQIAGRRTKNALGPVCNEIGTRRNIAEPAEVMAAAKKKNVINTHVKLAVEAWASLNIIRMVSKSCVLASPEHDQKENQQRR